VSLAAAAAEVVSAVVAEVAAAKAKQAGVTI
jgi:hypothetical protein